MVPTSVDFLSGTRGCHSSGDRRSVPFSESCLVRTVVEPEPESRRSDTLYEKIISVGQNNKTVPSGSSDYVHKTPERKSQDRSLLFYTRCSSYISLIFVS